VRWEVALHVDDATAYAAFATDRAWSGYAIADLDAPFRAYSRVAVARRGEDVAALLVLRHPAFTSIVPHGPPDGLAAILACADLPAKTHVFARDEQRAVMEEWFAYEGEPTAMHRMVVDAARFRAVPGEVERLDGQDVDALIELYSAYPENAFQPDQLASGVFYGVKEGGRLLAAAGTHVVSRRYGMAAVGSVYTRPGARGRGYAAATTSAVVGELLAGPCREAILNVAIANAPAVAVYRKLGFAIHCRHYEGLGRLR
jgi:ribosomal protein S18 acetylase RimI-like enzyme